MSDAQAYNGYLSHIGDRHTDEDAAKRRYYQGRDIARRSD